VAYTKLTSPTSTTPTAFAKFTLTNANPSYSTATIRVREGDKIYATIPNVNVSSNGQFSLNDITLNNLSYSSKVGSNNYSLTWEISFDGTNWVNFAVSSQKIHWLYAYNGPPTFESDPSGTFPLAQFSGIYDIGLEHSTGVIGPNGFDTPSEIATKLTQHIAGALYYKSSQDSNDDNPLNAFLTESDKNLQCSAHANILIALLRTVGINQQTVVAGQQGELKYFYGGGNPAMKNYYRNPVTQQKASLRVKRDPVDDALLDPHFVYHATVLLGGKSYDPSYGIVEDSVDIYTAINDARECKYGAEANLLKITKTAQEYDSIGGLFFPVTCGIGIMDSAYFISQTVPSYSYLGQSHSVQIMIGNSGATTWRNSEGYRLVSTNSNWGVTTLDLPQDVSPGQVVTFNFIITSPFTPGNYDFQWRMVRNGIPFNAATAHMQIEVSPDNECSWEAQQTCNWQGGSWNPLTCLCEGGY
jgi:hypothetical protein